MELLQELKARLAAVVAEYKKLFGKNNTPQTTTKTAAPPPKGNFPIKNAVGKDCKNDYLDVVTIQELLKKCGFYSGVIDGNYSIEIENAIKVAQKNSGNTQSAKIAGKNDATWVFLVLGKKLTTEELTKTFQMYNPITQKMEAHTYTATSADVALLTQMPKYDEYIKEAVSLFKDWGITVSMIKGYIAIESQAVSFAGENKPSADAARGLMQITRQTWQDVISKTNITNKDTGINVDIKFLQGYQFDNDVFDPKINILIGTSAVVLKMNSSTVKEAMLKNPSKESLIVKIAYNAGQGFMKTAIENAEKAGEKDYTSADIFLKEEYLYPAVEFHFGALYNYDEVKMRGKVKEIQNYELKFQIRSAELKIAESLEQEKQPKPEPQPEKRPKPEAPIKPIEPRNPRPKGGSISIFGSGALSTDEQINSKQWRQYDQKMLDYEEFYKAYQKDLKSWENE